MKILKRTGLKRFIISLFITGVLVYLAAPIYSKYQNKIISGNSDAKIDIYNKGSKDKEIDLSNNHSESAWCKKNESCTTLSRKISDRWKKFDVKFKALKDGEVIIYLRGPDKRDDTNNRYKVLVDYKDFIVNGKNILKKEASFWNDKPYKYSIKVKEGEVIKFSVKAKKPSFDGNNVDPLMLLSVLILAFLLSYKLVQYVAKFKIIENNSRIDIVFVIAFIILLFLPMSHISDATKSMQENRMFAEYPKFLTNNGINNKFGEQFNSWFSDRFWGREKTIKIHTNILYHFNSIYSNREAVFFKKSGWMTRSFIPNIPSDKNIDIIVHNIEKFDDFCIKNNMKLYVLIVPHKEMIYSDLFYNYAYDVAKEEKFQSYIKKITDSKLKERVVYPYEELKVGKKNDFVFFKQAHHWTDYGAFLGYEKLADIILKDFPEFKKVSLNDFNVSHSNLVRDDWGRHYNRGYTTRLLNLTDKPDEEILYTEYSYYDPKNSSNIKEKWGKYIKDFDNKAGDNEYRVFMVGNSQSDDLIQYIVASVKETKYLRLNKGFVRWKEEFKFMKHHKKLLLDFKPDIVILTVSSPAVSRLVDFYKD